MLVQGVEALSGSSRTCTGLQVLAYVSQVREVTANVDDTAFTLEQVEASQVRCPDEAAATQMYEGVRP